MTDARVSRRAFLASVAATAAAAHGPSADRPPRVLLRSSWQTVNIGDIGHTPGLLALLERYLPDAEVRLWPSSVGDGVKELLAKRFPKLAIVEGAAAQKAALAECDFLLHGSGPSLVGEKDVARWRTETGKPYGVYGITQAKPSAATAELLSGAAFAYFRDSVSLKVAKENGVTCPVMGFAPDAAFAVDVRADDRADAFLKANGLEPGKFLCCVSRLRWTPYWTIPGDKRPFDQKRHDYNQSKKEYDHAPIIRAVTEVVRETPMRVLLCPEDKTQIAITKENVYDKLPADAKVRVVWRDKYWLTDEAVSTYVRSAGLFCIETHSPIMAVGNGVPAILCRYVEQTTKGLMWRDIGLGEWLFDLDDPKDYAGVAPAAVAMAKDPAAAKAKALKAQALVRERQRETMASVVAAAKR
ncbi:MAG: polysaccharide pyruvyl transferase family protein [Gemmataceae bacterium]